MPLIRPRRAPTTTRDPDRDRTRIGYWMAGLRAGCPLEVWVAQQARCPRRQYPSPAAWRTTARRLPGGGSLIDLMRQSNPMPIVQRHRLANCAALLKAAVPRRRGGRLVANLAGHDSHGAIDLKRTTSIASRPATSCQVPEWTIVPGNSPTTTVIDGHWGFRVPRQRKGVRPSTIEKARSATVAACTIPSKPCRSARNLSDDGNARGYDWAGHR